MVILTAVYATVLNTVLLFAVKGKLSDPDTFGPFMYSSVIGLTLGGVVLAGIVYVLIGKHCHKQLANWTVISLIALMISFIPDVLLPLSTAADDMISDASAYPVIILVLMVMHVIPAWVVIYKFNKYAKSLENNA